MANCCTHDCNEGRDCPRRMYLHRLQPSDFAPPDPARTPAETSTTSPTPAVWAWIAVSFTAGVLAYAAAAIN